MTVLAASAPVRRVLAATVAALLLVGCSSSGGSASSAAAKRINAAKTGGDRSVIKLVRTETIPATGCKTARNVFATTDTADTGKKLAADELAYFTATWSPGSSCPAFLYLFRTGEDTHQSGFTVGAVIASDGILDVLTGAVGSPPTVEIRY